MAMIIWKIRYLDRIDRQFKDRHLYLKTETLAPEIGAAIELAMEASGSGVLAYRQLFQECSEDDLYKGRLAEEFSAGTELPKMACVPEYFEDDSGKQICMDEIAVICSGNPHVRHVPSGAEQHDIDFMLSQYQPIPITSISLSQEEITLFSRFRRDHGELADSAFAKNCRVGIKGGISWQVETAATEDEIRSFVMIFRLLYMAGEKASFVSATDLFARLVGDNPFAKWVAGVKTSYLRKLDSIVDTRPFQFTLTNTKRKRLIDVFLNTTYAHQGLGKNEHWQGKYKECLKECNGEKAFLFYFFLVELVDCVSHIRRAGNVIVQWFDRYCDQNAISDVAKSVAEDHPGIGAREKEEVRQHRLFREKIEELAKRMWADGGSPQGGHWQFLQEAEVRLRNAMMGQRSDER